MHSIDVASINVLYIQRIWSILPESTTVFAFYRMSSPEDISDSMKSVMHVTMRE